MLPFNKRPNHNGQPNESDSKGQDERRSGRTTPPAPRSQPRFNEPPAASARPFQKSVSDEEVTTFMTSPAKKRKVSPPRIDLSESAETHTAVAPAKSPGRAPLPPIDDEDDEDESRTQILHMPKGGKRGRPRTSNVALPPPAPSAPARAEAPRAEPRPVEPALPKARAVIEEAFSSDDATGFTMQLPSPPVARPAPAAGQPMNTHVLAASGSVVSSARPMQAPQVTRPPFQNMPFQPQPMTQGAMTVGMAGAPVQTPPVQAAGGMQAAGGAHTAMIAGGYGAVPAHFNVPAPGREDPPGTAVSLSKAGPKSTRKWLMAFAAMGLAACVASFALMQGEGSLAQATAGAFVDPSRAPGSQPVAPVQPGPVQPAPIQPAPVAAPVAAPISPADLLTQPVGQAAPGVVAVVPAPVATAPAVEGAALAGQPAVAAKPVAERPAAVQPAPPGPVAAAPAPKRPEPRVAAPAPKPVAAAPAPKPVAAAPAPKPVPAKTAEAAAPKPAPRKPGKGSGSADDDEMKKAADALAKAQLENSL